MLAYAFVSVGSVKYNVIEVLMDVWTFRPNFHFIKLYFLQFTATIINADIR